MDDGELRNLRELLRRRRAGAATARDEEALARLRRELGRALSARRAAARRPGACRGLERKRGSSQREGRRLREELVLRTTFACNQSCPFCFVPRGGPVPMPELERLLDEARRRSPGGRTLTISGGEPAADPRLPVILDRARRRGFSRFVIQTNAVALDVPGKVERLLARGATLYLVSLHAHEPALYDRLTGSRGLLPRALEGLRRLLLAADRGAQVIVNIVVTSANCEALPALAGLVAELARAAPRGARRPGLFFSMLNESGHETAPQLAVDLSRVAAPLRAAVERCAREGLRVEPFEGQTALPVCLLSARARLASPRAQPQERVAYAERFESAGPGGGRAKRPDCRRCRYDGRCAGVPVSYARRFGLGALRP